MEQGVQRMERSWRASAETVCKCTFPKICAEQMWKAKHDHHDLGLNFFPQETNFSFRMLPSVIFAKLNKNVLEIPSFVL